MDPPRGHADVPETLLNDHENRALRDHYARIVLARICKDKPNGIILIVGHSNTIPALILALGHSRAAAAGEKYFDRLLRVIPTSGGDARPQGFFQLRHYADLFLDRHLLFQTWNGPFCLAPFRFRPFCEAKARTLRLVTPVSHLRPPGTPRLTGWFRPSGEDEPKFQCRCSLLP